MFAEEYTNIYNQTPILTDQRGKTIEKIYSCLKLACSPFKKAKNQHNLKLPLNENKLTQIFIEQVEVFLKSIPNVGVKNQYSDTIFGSKGIPDFYFHTVEEGVHHMPIIVFEAKIITSLFSGTVREREYVKGGKKNGGIERFKIGKHGEGLLECGLLGFVEDNDFNFWNANINNWILEFNKDSFSIWKSDEILHLEKNEGDFCTLNSIAHRNSDTLKLYHIWITLN